MIAVPCSGFTASVTAGAAQAPAARASAGRGRHLAGAAGAALGVAPLPAPPGCRRAARRLCPPRLWYGGSGAGLRWVEARTSK